MCPLALGRLRSRSNKMPKAYAIRVCSTFQCPRCNQYIALMSESVEWHEHEWWQSIDPLGLVWTEELCACKHCKTEVHEELRYSENWDQIYVRFREPPEGYPFV